MVNSQYHRRVLLQRRSELRASLQREGDETQALGLTAVHDLAELANDNERASILISLRDLHAKELASVNAALDRMERGVYGLCVRCGNSISPQRLDATPESATCLQCARD